MRRSNALLAFIPLASAACAPPTSVPFQPCTLPGFSGLAECVRIDVPTDHDAVDGPTLKIQVARVSARRIRRHETPLVLLAGGPGQAAIEYAPLLESAFRRVNETRDILLIDQRGTGRSHPLQCDQLFQFAYRTISRDQIRAESAACLRGLDDEPKWFGTESVIRDLDAIRRRLGHEKLALWGASFGTRTALRYLARFPQRVESMVLDGVTSNTESLFVGAPRYAQAAFDALRTRCEADAGCDAAALNAHFEGAARAGTQAVDLIHPLSGARLSTSVDDDLVVNVVRGALYVPVYSSLIPVALDKVAKGDHSVLAALTAELTSSSAGSMYVGATLSVLCSEDIDRLSREAAAEAGHGTPFGDRYYRLWSTACSNWPRTRVPKTYGELVQSTVPTLVLSGGADPITPPAAAEVAIGGLSAAQHLIAKNASHNVTQHGCAPTLIADFLNAPNTPVDGECLNEIEAPPIVHTGDVVK